MSSANLANLRQRAQPSKARPAKSGHGRRLAAPDREQQILAGAIRYFAEVGFRGQTRELAHRLGITQPLLYRYFPAKKDLIERVFGEVFLKRLDPQWTKLMRNRELPLEERLVEFYQQYARATYTYEWIRIYMHSALRGDDINRRYIRIVEERLLKPICAELRHQAGLASPEKMPIGEFELEHIWVMHGGLFYYAVRKYIYHSRVSADFIGIVRRASRAMIAGFAAVAAEIREGMAK